MIMLRMSTCFTAYCHHGIRIHTNISFMWLSQKYCIRYLVDGVATKSNIQYCEKTRGINASRSGGDIPGEVDGLGTSTESEEPRLTPSLD